MTMGDRVAVMRKGVLQQFDHPQVLYDEPDNMFVAGFIGSPPMNMAEAGIVATATGSPPRSATRRWPSIPRSSRSASHPWFRRQDRGDRHPLGGPQRADAAQRRAGRPADPLQGHAHRGAGLGDRRPLRHRGCIGADRGGQGVAEDAHSEDKIGRRGPRHEVRRQLLTTQPVKPGDPSRSASTPAACIFDLETGLAIRE